MGIKVKYFSRNGILGRQYLIPTQLIQLIMGVSRTLFSLLTNKIIKTSFTLDQIIITWYKLKMIAEQLTKFHTVITYHISGKSSKK